MLTNIHLISYCISKFTKYNFISVILEFQIFHLYYFVYLKVYQ